MSAAVWQINASTTENIKPYYDYFIKKYKEHYSLFFPKNKPINNKPNIDDAIYARLYNLIQHFWLQEEEFKPIVSKSQFNAEPFINYFLKTAIEFKKSANVFIDEHTQQTHLLIYHGSPLYTTFKIPDGCIVVVLTPIGRFGVQDITKYELLKKNAESKKEFINFIQNPVCYKRNENDGLFANASVYFPGQYCYDISLSEETDQSYPLYYEWGHHKYTYKTDTDTDTEISKDTNEKQTTLHTLITKKGLRGLIFIDSCRALNTNPNIDFNQSIIMKQYETFIRILNKSVFFLKINPDGVNYEEDNDGFIDCDKIVIFDAFKSGCIKPLKYLRNASTAKTVNNIDMLNTLLRYEPELYKLSKAFSNANSESKNSLIRILNGSNVIKIISEWLKQCDNDPSIVSLNTLYTELISKVVDDENERKQLQIIIRDLLIMSLFSENLKLLFDILISFIIYLKLIGNNVLDNITPGILLIYLFKYPNNNLYLNGLELSTENIANFNQTAYIISKLTNNIFMRDNLLTGIPVSLIGKLEQNDTGNYTLITHKYKKLDLSGNPIDFTTESIKINNVDIPLVSEDFLIGNYDVLDTDNPELFKCISSYYEASMSEAEIKARASENSQAGGKQKYRLKKRKSIKRNKTYSKLSKKMISKN